MRAGVLGFSGAHEVATRDGYELVTALYFAVADLTGRGVEFVPQSDAQIIFSVLSLIVGNVAIAYIIGAVGGKQALARILPLTDY